ncbi:hypothetical protein G4G27_13825 [Sphingomonas sp. So64.6b]|uniref:hypothetical protein n=1 Tax=Sphingomonas sp. So64.6b TaxID=2997354 RepID=UPI0016006E42|nr:hypothetical protein [Sphingomonas sp. So64.6b]QNA84953.1 hypothetical protein G4G27_13825 [Sphingomonas sp. So64.6b]
MSSLLTILLPMLAVAAPAPAEPLQADRAGNRIEAFAAIKPQPGGKAVDEASTSALHCTADRKRCAQLSRDVDANVWTLHVFDRMPPPQGATPITSFALPGESGDAQVAIWPKLVVLAQSGSVMIGVETTLSTSFSGGGASSTTLRLIALDSKLGNALSVLNVPSGGSAMIRACFGEKDMKQRAGACHDEYAFDGTLAIDPTVSSGPARFIFTTRAKSYPGRVTRQADSLAAAALRKKDLKWAVDPVCSYRRVFALNDESGDYVPDKPIPPCDDYRVE